MKAIVNVTESWGIGSKGKLLCRIPADMKRFREMTTDKVVIMGLNTLLDMPGKKPLKNRINVVLAEKAELVPVESREACDCLLESDCLEADIGNFYTPGATVLIIVTSLFELVDIVSIFDQDRVFVCGGASIYRQLLPWCDTCYVTKNSCAEEADVFFPNLDDDPAWEITREGEQQESDGIRFRYLTYQRKA